VLPILAFPTRIEAISYLVAFGIGTVAAMAGFSWGMGFIATKCSIRGVKLYRSLMSACAVVAMGVGCFWLATSLH
jgi:sulfite exporter TauE/SafE